MKHAGLHFPGLLFIEDVKQAEHAGAFAGTGRPRFFRLGDVVQHFIPAHDKSHTDVAAGVQPVFLEYLLVGDGDGFRLPQAFVPVVVGQASVLLVVGIGPGPFLYLGPQHLLVRHDLGLLFAGIHNPFGEGDFDGEDRTFQQHHVMVAGEPFQVQGVFHGFPAFDRHAAAGRHVSRHTLDMFRDLGKFRGKGLGRGIPEINHATGQILEAVPLQGDIYRMGHPHELQRKADGSAFTVVQRAVVDVVCNSENHMGKGDRRGGKR